VNSPISNLKEMSRRAEMEARIARINADNAKDLMIADLEDKVIAMATGAEPTPWKTTVIKTDFVRTIYEIMEQCYMYSDSSVFSRKQKTKIGKIHTDTWIRFVLYVFQYMKTKGYLDGDNTTWEDTAGGSDEAIQHYMLEALETYE
jgi:hypothetical protein